MLTIKGYRGCWHVGEPLPIIRERVVAFQADGDELEVIIAALQKTAKVENNEINPFSNHL
jgi:hypothetical protein